MRKRTFAAILLVLMLLLIAISCVSEKTYEDLQTLPSDAVRLTCSISVTDGDTFKCGGETLRIIGIDTPEIHESSKPIGEYGEEAKEFCEDYVQENSIIYVIRKGHDNYGRTLAYVFGVNTNASVTFYEEEVTKNGLARPLIYDENAVPEYIDKIVDAYEKAYEDKAGIFSKWNTAPVIDNPSEAETHIGSIVWLEFYVTYVAEGSHDYYIGSDWAQVVIRKDGYDYLFGNDFDPYSYKNHKIRVYGELWYNDYADKAEIMLRAPFEIKIVY